MMVDASNLEFVLARARNSARWIAITVSPMSATPDTRVNNHSPSPRLAATSDEEYYPFLQWIVERAIQFCDNVHDTETTLSVGMIDGVGGAEVYSVCFFVMLLPYLYFERAG